MTEAQDHVDEARAVYDASAPLYVEFAGTELTAATETPVDWSLLLAFAELAATHPAARVADVGCGPGRVAALLSRLGLDVVGIDISPAMLSLARAAHPHLSFEEGRLDALPVADGSLAGAVCWYSIIHTPPTLLGPAFAELARAVAGGGHLLLAFQEGDGSGVHRPDAHGTGLGLTSYRHSTADVAQRLDPAGFVVHATMRREAELDHETTPQAFVLARRR